MLVTQHANIGAVAQFARRAKKSIKGLPPQGTYNNWFRSSRSSAGDIAYVLCGKNAKKNSWWREERKVPRIVLSEGKEANDVGDGHNDKRKTVKKGVT